MPEFQWKEKESSLSSIGIESSLVPTEVDYTTKFDPKPTPYELNNMGNSQQNTFIK